MSCPQRAPAGQQTAARRRLLPSRRGLTDAAFVSCPDGRRQHSVQRNRTRSRVAEVSRRARLRATCHAFPIRPLSAGARSPWPALDGDGGQEGRCLAGDSSKVREERVPAPAGATTARRWPCLALRTPCSSCGCISSALYRLARAVHCTRRLCGSPSRRAGVRLTETLGRDLAAGPCR